METAPFYKNQTSDNIQSTILTKYSYPAAESLRILDAVSESQIYKGLSLLNSVSMGIFIFVFACFLYLIKRYLTNFISFYILKEDYRRMRCVEVDLDTEALPIIIDEEAAVQATQDVIAFRSWVINKSMTERFFDDYKRIVISNLSIYHPITVLIP